MDAKQIEKNEKNKILDFVTELAILKHVPWLLISSSFWDSVNRGMHTSDLRMF